VSQVHPQEESRRYRRFTDRHGRTFEAIVDTKTNDPVSRLRPLFRAPWMPPEGLVRLKHDQVTGAATVDLGEDAVIESRKAAHKDWTERLFQVGGAMHGQAFDPDNPTPQLIRMVGVKPEPIEYALAAKAGDPWVLGLDKIKPAWAKKLSREAAPVQDDYAFLRAEQLEASAKYEDIEDAVDPQATGGKRQRVGNK
jgi:hypothetical protein